MTAPTPEGPTAEQVETGRKIVATIAGYALLQHLSGDVNRPHCMIAEAAAQPGGNQWAASMITMLIACCDARKLAAAAASISGMSAQVRADLERIAHLDADT